MGGRSRPPSTGVHALVAAGKPRSPFNATVRRANVELAKAGRNPLEGITNHSLRRTFCALPYEAGASPAYVMAQMGHADASLALEIHAEVVDANATPAPAWTPSSTVPIGHQ